MSKSLGDIHLAIYKYSLNFRENEKQTKNYKLFTILNIYLFFLSIY